MNGAVDRLVPCGSAISRQPEDDRGVVIPGEAEGESVAGVDEVRRFAGRIDAGLPRVPSVTGDKEDADTVLTKHLTIER